MDLTRNGTLQAGYYLGPEDGLGLVVELMNEAPEARDAVLSLEWTVVDGRPDGWRVVVPVWLDVDGVCGEHGSEIEPPSNKTFTLVQEDVWRADLEGEVVFGGGHVHDGGTGLEIVRNGVVVCDSVAGYAESEGYVQMVDMVMEMEHISSMRTCAGFRVDKGDEWRVRADYDFGKHAYDEWDGAGAGYGDCYSVCCLMRDDLTCFIVLWLGHTLADLEAGISLPLG